MMIAKCANIQGLPPNLTADEPSKSFLMKGIDIGVAALQAELGFLSGSIVSHVQTAEMSNQALNSMALVSARYTHTALDVLFQLSSYYLFALCQALDLRAMQHHFLSILQPAFEKSAQTLLVSSIALSSLEKLNVILWPAFQKELHSHTNLDSVHRIRKTVTALQPLILEHVNKSALYLPRTLERWTREVTAVATQIYTTTRAEYIENPDATALLGAASKRMYVFVRREIGVGFVSGDGEYGGSRVGGEDRTDQGTLGDSVSKIYRCLRQGSGFVPVMECLREAIREEKGLGVGKAKLWVDCTSSGEGERGDSWGLMKLCWGGGREFLRSCWELFYFEQFFWMVCYLL